MEQSGNLRADICIDSLEFARGGRQVAGVVPVRNLRRLVDALADGEGNLAWSVQGEFVADESSAGRKPFLRIEVTGELHLKCQRCLGALPFPVHVASRLLLVPPGASWPDEDLEEDGFDPVEALKDQSVHSLIEDEVLLALPISPRHDGCPMPAHDDGKAKASPFAGLARLKARD